MSDGSLHFLENEYNLTKQSTSMIYFQLKKLNVSKCFVNLNICFFLCRLFNIFVDLFIFLFIYYLALLSIYLFHIKNDGMSSFGRNHNHYLLWLCERVVAVHKFHFYICLSPPPPLKKERTREDCTAFVLQTFKQSENNSV